MARQDSHSRSTRPARQGIETATNFRLLNQASSKVAVPAPLVRGLKPQDIHYALNVRVTRRSTRPARQGIETMIEYTTL